MPDESTYLAWSKTIEGVAFRGFAFTEGCGHCDACRAAAANGAPPVWAIYMRPRADRDEWCLATVAVGNFQSDSRERLADAVRKVALEDDEPAEEWRKLAALIGMSWREISAEPYHVARRQKEASDEFLGAGLLGRIFRAATEDELRGVRAEYRKGAGSFGASFGKLWWTLVKRLAHRGR